jgi:hypothetical protein
MDGDGARMNADWVHRRYPSCGLPDSVDGSYGECVNGRRAMSEAKSLKSAEIDRNWDKFLELLPTLTAEHRGQWVLMRHASIVDFFDTAMDAQIAGNRKFDDKIFSIQPVKEEAEELGYYSYAVDPRSP